MKEKKLPQILDVKTVGSSRLFSIEQVDLVFNNGEQRKYERTRGGNRVAVLVVPIDQDGFVLLGREYQVGIENYEVGLVKGVIDAGEAAVDAANRELQEEIGFAAKNLREICQMHTSPGYNCSKFKVVFAWGLYESKLAGDEPEPIELVRWPFDRLLELCEREDVNDARSVAALFRVRAWYEQHRQQIKL